MLDSARRQNFINQVDPLTRKKQIGQQDPPAF